MAFGVAFSIRADLGTSPISSVPYVISLIAPVTVGTATIAMHAVFVLLQILLLRRQFALLQLLQLPAALLFGLLTDLAVYLLGSVTPNSYQTQWLLCAVGIFLVALGVSVEVAAQAVPLAGEGLILALCKRLPVKCGNMKVCFDVTLVTIAVLIGLFSTGTLVGVREGTVAAALFVGLLTRQIGKPVAVIMNRAAMHSGCLPAETAELPSSAPGALCAGPSRFGDDLAFLFRQDASGQWQLPSAPFSAIINLSTASFDHLSASRKGRGSPAPLPERMTGGMQYAAKQAP